MVGQHRRRDIQSSWPLAIVWLFVSASIASGLDCNKNGVEDLDDVGSGSSADCNANAVPDECEVVSIQFGAGDTPRPVTADVVVTRTGDFNGDGAIDIVTGSTDRDDVSTISILANNGNATFENAVEYPAGNTLETMEVADLNGDSFPDVVTANRDVVLFFLNNGDGTLADPDSFASPDAQIRFLVTGDLNNDGAPEIIAGERLTTSILVLMNDGFGSFPNANNVEVSLYPLWITTGDFDNDQDLDIATLNKTDSNISVLLNDGNASFAPAVNYPIEGSTLTLIESDDVDGDGSEDLLVVARDTLLIYPNLGDGTFDAPFTQSAAAKTTLSLRDYDGDGDIDLAMDAPRESETGFPGGLRARANNGEGDFGVSFEFILDTVPTSLGIADLNGDGAFDLAGGADDHVDILINGRPSQADAVQVNMQNFAPLEGCKRLRFGCAPHSGAVADFDGDGDLDVCGTNTHPGSLTMLLNAGNGDMVIKDAYTFGGEHPQHSTVGDINGDGAPDMLSVDNFDHRLWYHENRGDATWLPPRRFPVGSAPINVTVGDFDLDGNLDAATANEGAATVSFLFNDGNGNLTMRAKRDYAVGNGPRCVQAGDIDGDDDIDLAVANNGGASISILLNNGDSTFADAVHYPQLGNPHFLTLGDLDRDGDLDIGTANKNRKTISILLGNGDGTFGGAVDYDQGRGAYSMISVDFDADGNLDLVTGNEVTSSVSVFLGNGDGTVRSPTHLEVGPGLRFVLAGDFDADGDLDLVTTNRGNRSFTILYNESELGIPDFQASLCTASDFQELAATTPGSDRFFVKFITPATDDSSLLPTMFQNSKRFALHQDFLSEFFSDRFPLELYTSLTSRRATRLYYVGSISRVRSEEGLFYGFRFVADFEDPFERPTIEEVQALHDDLKETFSLETLAFFPDRPTGAILEELPEWQDTEFPVVFDNFVPPNLDFVPYTVGVGYGRVRLMNLDAFEAANNSGQFSVQDILVIDQAPRDIQGIVSGIVTGALQGELSHLSVRTARRGTPNAFLSEALIAFDRFDGELVRFEVKDGGYLVGPATLEQAEEWWVNNRQSVSEMPGLDPDYAELTSLAEIADMHEAGLPLDPRFGGKASNLARLQSILTGRWAQYQERGFSVPVRYYLEFMRTNTLFTENFRRVTYEDYLLELAADERFQTDPQFRFGTLENLRAQMRDSGVVDPALINAVAARAEEVFGTPQDVRVRYRSSSNVEDALEFNGAGLYDSTSGCSADDLDDDDVGPSICDPTRANERGITRALKKVWASLWNFGAYEERAFYSIPQDLAAMAVAVNRTFINEQANGVAFTGNPINPFDRRYVVTVQPGEASVVSPDPGILAEKNVLELVDGEVTDIIRAIPSSLVPEGTFVLSDAELRELGELLWHIDKNFPLEIGTYDRRDIILDLEFKKVADTGDLVVKQVRPFLLPDTGTTPPTFALEIPSGTTTCSDFAIARTVRQEYELKAVLHFASGTVELPSGDGAFSGELLEFVEIGQDRHLANLVSAGIFRVERTTKRGGLANYRFSFKQSFVFGPDDELFEFELSQLDFTVASGTSVGETLLLDTTTMLERFKLDGSLGEGEGDDVNKMTFSPCGLESYPLWEVRAELDDGTAIYLEQRFLPDDLDTGLVQVTHAEVLFGNSVRTEEDYYDLVYASARHNVRVEYWIILDPPVTLSGVDRPIHIIEILAPEDVELFDGGANYRDENLEIIAPVELASYSETEFSEITEPQFRRGDVDTNGQMDISDALSLLSYLFSTGEASCQKAADTNDDGLLNLTDAIRVVLYLFEGKTVPAPFLLCGSDPTRDNLSCGAFSTCQ